jgi:hypothetical protein
VITVHALSDQGFIPDAYIHLNSYELTADFHRDKTYKTFQKWLTERPITNLPPHSVLVIYIVMYHNM